MVNSVPSHSKAFRVEGLVLALFCLLAASCDLPHSREDEKGSLTIVLPGTMASGQNSTATARAVYLPEPITGNMSYTIDFYNSGGSFSVGPTREKVITVKLEPGFWDIVVTAHYGADPAMAAADKKPQVEIRAGQANFVSFTMNADEFLTPYINGNPINRTMSVSDPAETFSITMKTSTAFTVISGWTDGFSYQVYYIKGLDGPRIDVGSGGSFATGSPGLSWTADPSALGPGTFYYYADITNNYTYAPSSMTGAATNSIYMGEVEVTSGTSYSVGSTGPGGGTVFYYDSAGFISNGVTCHYLEAASTTYASTAGWGADGTSIPGATGTAIGTGYANTQAIVTVLNGLSEMGTAAQLAWDHSEGGQSDWFLPSKDELGELYTSGVVGNLIGGSIWSSTEVDATYAWCGGDASPPVGYWQDPKTGILGIHPIRAF